MTTTKIYKIKSLVPGSKIPELDSSKTYVAIPDKGYKDCKKIKATYGKEAMIIKSWHKALAFKKFHNLFGEGYYILGYFLWEPTETEVEYEFSQNGTATPILGTK